MSDQPPEPPMPPDQPLDRTEPERLEPERLEPLRSPAVVARQRIIEKLMEKGGGEPTCPLCGKHEFGIGMYVHFENGPVIDPRPHIAPKVYPTVAVICQTCGTTQFVNLLVLGFTAEQLRTLNYQLEAADDAEVS